MRLGSQGGGETRLIEALLKWEVNKDSGAQDLTAPVFVELNSVLGGFAGTL